MVDSNMPRVIAATKNRAGKKIACGHCGHKIEPGEKYFHFSFRYGGKHYRCGGCPPKPSELTQSKLSGAYSAVESATAQIDDIRMSGELDSLTTILEACADEIDQVRDEYQESLENMGENLAQGCDITAHRNFESISIRAIA
jgi:hypothetical protein